MSSATTENDHVDPSRSLFKNLGLLAAVLLGLTTVLSAWGVYQSARWSGSMTIAFNEALIDNNDAGKLFSEGDAEYNLDQTLFVEVVIAIQEGDLDRAVYIQETLFSDQLYAAYDTWSATGDDGPDTPFEMDEYVVQQWIDGYDLEDDAEALFTKARDDNQTSDNYVLITVALASALFFAGMASTVREARAAQLLFIIGCVVFAGAGIALITQPVL